MEQVRRQIIVSGRVQGVGYRASCRTRARELGVRGSVRNRADGSVEVIAQGSADGVDRLVEWCREGPRHARVNAVDVTDEGVAVDAEDFRIVT